MDEREILRTELRWGAVVAGAVALIIVVIVASSASMLLHPPSNVETIDPVTIHLQGEFADGNLGTRMNSNGSVTSRIVATQFAFVPSCIAVPVGRPVTIRLTSPDVIHGFLIAGTNVNAMIIPGFVSEVRTTFSAPGDHLMPCHEFCGLGHSEMWSIVRVLPEGEWRPDADGQVSCAPS